MPDRNGGYVTDPGSLRPGLRVGFQGLWTKIAPMEGLVFNFGSEAVMLE